MVKAKSVMLMAVVGLLAGSGGGAAVALMLPGSPPAAEPVPTGDGKFVTLGALLLPLTLPDGRYTGYFRVEAQLEVAAEDVDGVTARLPLVIHGVNLTAYTRPLATGADGRLPDAPAIRAIVAAEAGKVLGKGVVRSVALTSLAPA